MPQHSKNTKQTWGGNKNMTYERVLKEVPRVPALPYAPAGPPNKQLSSRLQSWGFNKTQEAIKKGLGDVLQQLLGGTRSTQLAAGPSPQPPALGGGTGQQPLSVPTGLTRMDEPTRGSFSEHRLRF